MAEIAPWLTEDKTPSSFTPPPEEQASPVEKNTTIAPWLSKSEEKPKEPDVGPMPGPIDALTAGIKHSISDIGQSTEVVKGQKPTEVAPDASPAASGFEWRDLAEPTRGLSKVAYQTGASSPTIGAGVLGGLAGSLAGPIGTTIGGIGGAASGAALQTIGPAFAQELKKQPNDPDGAWDRAVQSSLVSGAASGASWAAFPLKVFSGPLKNLAFQAFGVQPAINVAEKGAQNVITGDPVTSGLGQSYVQGAVGTAVPAIGHMALRGRFGEAPTKEEAPTPAESAAKAAEWRQQAQDNITQAASTPHPHIRNKLLREADNLNEAADYESNRHALPAQAAAKEQQADLLDQQAQTQGYSALAQQVYKDSASAMRRSADHDLFAANIPKGLEKTTGPLGWIKKNYLDNIAPEMVSESALKADAIMAGYKSRQNYIETSLRHLGDATYRQKWNDEVPWADQLRFLTAYEMGLPVPPDLQAKYPWTRAAEPEYRKQLAADYDEEVGMGSKAHFLTNYMPHFWMDPQRAERLFDPQRLTQSMGDTWFQKARTYELMELGIQNGLEPKYKNIQDIVTARRIAGADMINKMQMLRDLQRIGVATPLDQAPAHVKNPNLIGDPYEWQPVNAPDRQQWLIAPDAQMLWKNGIESKGLWSDPGKMGNAFRGWMAAKNYWVPIKLALSAFHFVHVAHINAVNNMSRAMGEAFGSGQQGLARRFAAVPEAMLQAVADPFFRAMPYMPFAGKRMIKAWETARELQTPRQAAQTQIANEAGVSLHMSDQLRMKGERAFWDAYGQNKYLSALVPGVGLAYKKTMGAMFEKWIPSLKAAALEREAEALFRRRPDLINDDMNRKVALRAIGKQIDSRFGEMFYGSLFWNRTLKDASIGSFLSLGWNLGFLREFGGGAFEPIVRRMLDAPTPTRKLVRDTTNKTTNMFLYSMTAMGINAMMNYMFTGEGPNGLDYVFPRIGGLNPDGSPRRVTNAFYTREVPMAMKNIEERQSVAGGLMQMMYHKMMFDPLVEMVNNRDYFGNQIRDENSPAYQQIWQMGKHLVGDQLNPMSVAGAKRALELSGKPSTTTDVLKQLGDRDVVMPLMGFGPAPSYASKSAMDNRIQYLFHHHVDPEYKEFNTAEIAKKRAEARTAYLGAKQRGDDNERVKAAQTLAQLGVKTTEIAKLKPGGNIEYMFKRLPAMAQVALLKEMSPEEFKTYYSKANKKVAQRDPSVRQLFNRYYNTEGSVSSKAPWLEPP